MYDYRVCDVRRMFTCTGNLQIYELNITTYLRPVSLSLFPVTRGAQISSYPTGYPTVQVKFQTRETKQSGFRPKRQRWV